MKLEFLVTGTGRSGTVYMARLLSSIGIMCGHESVFKHDGLQSAWKRLAGEMPVQTSEHTNSNDSVRFDPVQQRADSSYLAAPFASSILTLGAKVIHVVRDPLKVISSTYYDANFFTAGTQRPFLEFVESWAPEVKKCSDNREKAMAYWLYWNRLAQRGSEQRESIRVKVESEVDERLFKFLEVTPEDWYRNPKANCWHNRSADFRLDDLPNGQVKTDFVDLASEYGYNLRRRMIAMI
jgi:hypothetical protein